MRIRLLQLLLLLVPVPCLGGVAPALDDCGTAMLLLKLQLQQLLLLSAGPPNGCCCCVHGHGRLLPLPLYERRMPCCCSCSWVAVIAACGRCGTLLLPAAGRGMNTPVPLWGFTAAEAISQLETSLPPLSLAAWGMLAVICWAGLV